MEVEEIQSEACKFSRIGNGRIDSSKVSQKDQYPDDEEDGEQQKKQQKQLRLIRRAGADNDTGGGLGGDNTGCGGGGNRLRGWHHSSRIIRVSRASGGKDRHSKVWTSKGLRDRRVRLSVTTAIQFYDLQDRLGYDQPSKAVEWLVNAAADSIAELPSLSNFSFPDTPNQLSDESKKASEGTDQLQQGLDSVDQLDQSQSQSQSHRRHGSISKSACSSNSETSKGSSLYLSRSELGVNRVKASERAAKEKKNQKENESQFNANQHHHHHVNPISLSSSFTELLTGGISSVDNNNDTSPSGSSQPNEEANFFHNTRPWTATPLDYFHSGLFGPSSSRPPHHFTGQIQLGSSNSLPQAMAIPAPFSMTNENHQEMQHFSFVPDQYLIPVTATQPGPGGDCNLNFTISAGLDGYNRRTLQSNSSPSLLPHLQRYGSSSPIDGSNVPFFIGTTPPVENHHHQFSAGFDGRLHLYYGDGSRHSGQKDKGKN